MGWIEPNKWFIRDDNCKFPLGLFLNSATVAGLTEHPPGQWSTLDLSGVTSTNAKGAFLSGILIITHGSVPEIADMEILFRNIGDTVNEGNYHGQCIEADTQGGQRSTYSTFVPLTGGKCELWWNHTSPGSYPQYSAYGANLSVQAYFE